ncbi:hypothetical protein [Pseudomonas sp. TSRC2-2]|uniref:hypothetical protein n=1 Tax=unclassified Pseudomonas TaxID=196821 RepID=UPI003CE9AEA1
MSPDARRELADELASLLGKKLGGELYLGTGRDLRERSEDLARLIARVTAAVMHEGPADGELLIRIRRYETEMLAAAKEIAVPAWKAAT